MNDAFFNDTFMGEDPANLPKHEASYGIPIGYQELPEKYIQRLPQFLTEENKFYIGPNGDIKTELKITNKFLFNIVKHYNLKRVPSREEMLFIIENEMEKVFKNF